MPVLTRLYENYPSANAAAGEVNALRIAGVETSIVGGEKLSGHYAGPEDGTMMADGPIDTMTDEGSATATGAGVGAVVGGGAGLLAGLGMLAIPGIGPLVAAGWLAATAVGAAGGAVAGGAVGAVVDLGIDEEDMPVYSESFRRGGVAVSVQFPEHARMDVEAALDRTSAADLTDLRNRFADDGWDAEETVAEREARLRTEPMPPVVF